MTAVCDIKMAVTLEMRYNHMYRVQMYKEGGDSTGLQPWKSADQAMNRAIPLCFV